MKIFLFMTWMPIIIIKRWKKKRRKRREENNVDISFKNPLLESSSLLESLCFSFFEPFIITFTLLIIMPLSSSSFENNKNNIITTTAILASDINGLPNEHYHHYHQQQLNNNNISIPDNNQPRSTIMMKTVRVRDNGNETHNLTTITTTITTTTNNSTNSNGCSEKMTKQSPQQQQPQFRPNVCISTRAMSPSLPPHHHIRADDTNEVENVNKHDNSIKLKGRYIYHSSRTSASSPSDRIKPSLCDRLISYIRLKSRFLSYGIYILLVLLLVTCSILLYWLLVNYMVQSPVPVQSGEWVNN